MDEAKGNYKNETIYICQIKSKNRRVYHDNISTKTLETDLEGLEKYAKRNMVDVDWRIIKRTLKEDLITAGDNRQSTPDS